MARFLVICFLIFLPIPLMTGCICFNTGPTEFSLNEIEPNPASLMVRSTSSVPLYINVNSEVFPDRKRVLVNGDHRRGYITDVHSFAVRDLKAFFSNYFDEVHVLIDSEIEDEEPHFIVDVQLNRFNVQQRGSDGHRSYGVGVLTWSLGMAFSEVDHEYLMSVAGDSAGTVSGHPDEMLRNTFEAAIGALAQTYSENNLHALVMEITEVVEAGGPVPDDIEEFDHEEEDDDESPSLEVRDSSDRHQLRFL